MNPRRPRWLRMPDPLLFLSIACFSAAFLVWWLL